MAKTPPEQTRAFLAEAILSETDECIEWPYARVEDGYGAIRFEGRYRRTHALVCEQAYGLAPEDKPCACHTCHNPPCINPRHLYWGSRSDNSMDASRAGRHYRGEKNIKAVLTEADVLAIREAQGATPASSLAADYGVTKGTIYHIWRRLTWQHV